MKNESIAIKSGTNGVSCHQLSIYTCPNERVQRKKNSYENETSRVKGIVTDLMLIPSAMYELPNARTHKTSSPASSKSSPSVIVCKERSQG